MWPVLLDMTKEESMQNLRNLELQAYAQLVSALRAQGPLNPDKRKLLKDTSQVLNIPQDRHKAEIRRAINDEKLNTIAYHVTGLTESLEDWAQEGRRTVPLIPRMAPQTAFSAIADEVAETASVNNKHLPSPACTERKRPPSQSLQILMSESSKGIPFRVPDAPKTDESKKRKLPICTENSTLAQHLLGPPKINRTQAIYRQRTKALLKEHSKLKSQQTKVPFSPHLQTSNGPRMSSLVSGEETIEQIQNEINSYVKPAASVSVVPTQETVISNENQAPRPKLITSTKSFSNLNFKQIITSGPSCSNASLMSSDQKSFKMCTPKKTVSKTTMATTATTTPLGQKLIVVSNAQTIQSNSILQKSLSLPLVKNISVKNLDKFKIVTTSSPQIVTAATANNLNSIKHKVVTVKTNPTTKKVIPLSLLNSKGGIKVLPIGGKIVGKSTTTTSSSPLYIVSTIGAPKPITSLPPQQATVVNSLMDAAGSVKENGKSSVLGDILKASGVTTDDFDAQITEFRIPNSAMDEEVGREQVEDEQPEEAIVPLVTEEKQQQEELVVMETDESLVVSEECTKEGDIETVVVEDVNNSSSSISNEDTDINSMTLHVQNSEREPVMDAVKIGN